MDGQVVPERKVGIITFSDFNTNFGSMLQSLAMKSFLEQRGGEVKFIRYREFNSPGLMSPRLRFRDFLRRLYAVYRRKDLAGRARAFEAFRKRFFSYTPLLTSSEALKRNLEPFDIYIAGSDQIWNVTCLGGVRSPYFLDFAPPEKIRVAYAPSLGEYQLTEETKKVFERLLKNLDEISVREKQSVEQIQPLTEKKVHHVLDPVFLLDAEEWASLLPEPEERPPYILCYFTRRNPANRKLVSLVREKLDLPVINVSDNMIYLGKTSHRHMTAGPLEFLSLVKNARLLIGNSFHLTAFSIIFDKPLLLLGTQFNRNRVMTILDLVGGGKNFLCGDEIEHCDPDAALARKYDHRPLRELIRYSRDYLTRAVGLEPEGEPRS